MYQSPIHSMLPLKSIINHAIFVGSNSFFRSVVDLHANSQMCYQLKSCINMD